jgi:hypothetical protein
MAPSPPVHAGGLLPRIVLTSGFGYASRAELRAQFGCDVRDLGHGERILASAIVEKFVMRADGELEPATAESSRPIALTQTHADIAKVKRYSFDMP